MAKFRKKQHFFVTHYRTINYKNATKKCNVSKLTLAKNLLKTLFFF